MRVKEFVHQRTASIEKLPVESRPGTYALILKCQRTADVSVGRLGHLKLEPGFYVYVGSAFGPGGIRGRLAHHTRPVMRPHWHIDYIRSEMELVEVWFQYGRKSRECNWARRLATMSGASVPMAGFGASDCDCESHLLFYKECPNALFLSSPHAAADSQLYKGTNSSATNVSNVVGVVFRGVRCSNGNMYPEFNAALISKRRLVTFSEVPI